LILSLVSQGGDPGLILRLLEAFEASTLRAVSGQHRDILSEQQPMQGFSQEECLDIAAAKAGSLVRLALQMGAICAGADDDLLQQLSELGDLLGISHQLDNDAHDLYDLLQGNPDLQLLLNDELSARSAKSDLERGKKTLPIVLAAGQKETLQRIVELTDEEKKELLRTFNEAIITAWGMCLLYRERARECLQTLEARKPVTPSLRMLLGLA
jgi:geranylgeranyl pyrophosphate synthase